MFRIHHLLLYIDSITFASNILFIRLVSFLLHFLAAESVRHWFVVKGTVYFTMFHPNFLLLPVSRLGLRHQSQV